MEGLTVNEMLTEKITKINNNFIPPGFVGSIHSTRLMQRRLAALVDILGIESAKAQGLGKVITSAEKLRISENNILYLLKDHEGESGKGELIGLLKVGRKNLFLFDENNKVCEVEPLCVLDFYVVPTHQGKGQGKLLFDHMLRDTGMSAHELPIDGPSAKMELFLKRSYGIERLIKQANNFAVSPQFFEEVAEIRAKSGRTTPAVSPMVGRFAAAKPATAIGTIIHGNDFLGQETRSGNPPKLATADTEIQSETPKPQEKELIKDETVETNPEEEGIKGEDTKSSPERPSTLSVEPITESTVPILSPAGSTTSRRDSQLTDRGFFDVKFYHNKLW